ncbi:MAG: glycosyltransferase [Dysgonamonadaceae bacterium]|jgi:glycosyltransferase involved in cell wall biosynthesis|nr:glycosyltransferase [Dysgonamonadaceae bacterium]
MKPSVKISVIVPVYNTAALLPRCIDSLLAQTLQDIEIILIDDASTDNSWDIMQDYRQKYPDKLRTIHSEINRRQGGARNLGIEAAQGEYLGFVDSDDWAEKEMYKLLYNKAIEDDSDLCYCYRRQVTETGVVSEDSNSYFLPEGQITEALRKEMIAHHITFTQRYIYRRTLFSEHHIRFPEHLRYEDLMIDPLFLLYANRIAAVKQSLYNYFVHSNSTVTAVNDTKYRDKLKVCEMIAEEYKQRNFYERYHNEIAYLFFRKGYIHTVLNYIINARSPKKEVIVELKNALLLIDNNYRETPYYKQRWSFRVIDRILDYPFLLKGLKAVLKATKYNV